MELTSKRTIVKILEFYGIRVRKSLGQHFLVDKEVLKQIIKAAALNNQDTVLEIGAGLGTLTQELCQRAQKVIAVEKDQRLSRILEKICGQYGNLEIIAQDILKVNLARSFALKAQSYKVVANLPYQITSPVLKKFLLAQNKPSLMVLMVQREVAERICAPPGKMSILSIMVQLYAQPVIVTVISPTSFFPPPRVESALIRLFPIAKKIVVNEKAFFRCIKIGFSSPRKTLVNNLVAGFQEDKEQIRDVLKRLGLNDKVRAQELTIKQWQKLTQLLENK